MDALRGVALTMMFADHIPQNLLNRFTLRNLGFCDAAEIFVLLAGFASLLAYGRAFEREGLRGGFARLLARCVRLYLFQIAMLMLTIGAVTGWRRFHSVPVDFLEPELAHGWWRSLWRAMSLEALPGNLNILPLYIVLLLLFPPIYWVMRRRPWLALGLSAALWLLINLDPALNLPNWLDPDGWYFNPFAWQFLFTIGAFAALKTRLTAGSLPRHPALVALAWAYLLFSALESFPWASWHLPDPRLFVIPPPEKTPLSPLRLIDVLAIFYLVQSSPLAQRVATHRVGQVWAVLGRHSLEIFTAGTVLDLLAKLLFNTYGTGWALQVGVNVVGFGLLYLLARALDSRKNRRRNPGGRPDARALPGASAG
ncbi:OpgC family protein [Rhizosaccharibacter radicis]|uniref:OpgC family protein n=1 Tax=Rhizosaccharibacter radicis TaxID=2782605 RepID=UPI003BF601C3